jgi:hypothetical protein
VDRIDAPDPAAANGARGGPVGTHARRAGVARASSGFHVPGDSPATASCPLDRLDAPDPVAARRRAAEARRVAAVAAAQVRHPITLFLRPPDLATVRAIARTRGMSVPDWATEVLEALAADVRTARRIAHGRQPGSPGYVPPV